MAERSFNHVVFLVDCSSSMDITAGIIPPAINKVVQTLQVPTSKIQISIFLFNDVLPLRTIALCQSPTEVRPIQDLDYMPEWGTDIAYALRTARETLGRQGIRKGTLVLITDVVNTDEPTKLELADMTANGWDIKMMSAEAGQRTGRMDSELVQEAFHRLADQLRLELLPQ
jgi:uncharacterized protein with von Willebrand factor type A (vWA) domain